MKLKTKRLLLRPITMKDCNSLIENINNLNVSKWLLMVPYPYTKKDAKWWIENCKKESKKKNREDYQFTIELKSEKKQVGGIGLTHIDLFQGTAEVGYWLGENYWRKGYGSEALKEVLRFAFNKLKLRRVWAPVFKGNPSSGKLLEKFGFKKEGEGRKSVRCKATGKIHDDVLYGLLKEEWRKIR